MESRGTGFTCLVVVLLALAATVQAAPIQRREPGPKAKGEVFEWTSKNKTVYNYRVPKIYDAEKGANLTFILHGSNLNRNWGFANHSHKTFRPDDIVVSPDGTSSNGQGGFNSMGRPNDAKRFHEFHRELKSIFKVNRTYVYGHSQGSFFAFYYAGEFPAEVDGVVGHASGVWTQTRLGRKGHHQAIVLMHGTRDPVVGYGQSVGGFSSFRDAKYPMVRLRSLEFWNHWPAEHNGKVPHTSQQIAWCEGMTTEDPDRLAVCLENLCDVKSKERHDYAAAYQVAARIAGMKEAPAKLKSKAEKVMKAVNDLAAMHVKEMKIPKKAAFDGKPWIGHMPFFLRRFGGVPACDEFEKTWEKTLESHRAGAIKHLRKFWPAYRKPDPKEGFVTGVAAVKAGFLYWVCTDKDLLGSLKRWHGDAQKLRLPKQAVKDYVQIVMPFEKAIDAGWKSFEKIQRKAPKLP